MYFDILYTSTQNMEIMRKTHNKVYVSIYDKNAVLQTYIMHV